MINMPIGKIHRTHILDIYQENGVGNDSNILIHKVLNAMFNYAASEEMIRCNYAKGCKRTRYFQLRREMH